MIAPIKRYDALGDIDGGYLKASADGRVVLYADHLASHAYDEAVELMECAKFIQEMAEKLERHGMMPMSGLEESAIRGAWKMCAKARAKRFGGAE